jgi:hypothetical protein
MAGHLSGVSARIQAEERKVIATHCHMHSLNLAVQETCSDNPLMRDFLCLLSDLVGFLRDSPKRCQTAKQKAVTLMCPIKNIRPLCPTRFSVKFRAIDAAKVQKLVHIETLKAIMDESKDRKIKATASGFLRRLHEFDYYFALVVAHTLFGITDRLSTQLQSSTISIGDSFELTKFALSEIANHRSEPRFMKIWEEANQIADEVGVSSRYSLNIQC